MASEGDMEPAQTQSQSNEIDTNGLILHENETEVWGRLIAKNTALVNYGEANIRINIDSVKLTIFLCSVERTTDLTSSVFTAGRMASLSCCFTQSLGSRMYLQLSKTHFKITKDLSDPLSPVYLEVSRENQRTFPDRVINTFDFHFCNRIFHATEPTSINGKLEKARNEFSTTTMPSLSLIRPTDCSAT